MKKCPFCDKRNMSKHEILYEDKNHMVFFSKHPITPGHTLVIPKKHVKSLLRLSEEETSNLFKLVRKTALLIKKKLKPAGLDIGTNYGKIAGQTVYHLHIHVVPRYSGDVGYLQLVSHDITQKVSKQEQSTLANKLRGEWQ